MAMIACPSCHQSVGTAAAVCPHCGAPGPASQARLGTGYEWKSSATFLGIPWVHVAWGRDGDGRRRVAKGMIAIGQFAIGGVTIAQFGLGVLFGFGQFVTRLAAIGQGALAVYFGIGQAATGETVIGQVAAGVWVLAQFGFGTHVWSTGRKDPEALEYFKDLAEQLGVL